MHAGENQACCTNVVLTTVVVACCLARCPGAGQAGAEAEERCVKVAPHCHKLCRQRVVENSNAKCGRLRTLLKRCACACGNRRESSSAFASSTSPGAHVRRSTRQGKTPPPPPPPPPPGPLPPFPPHLPPPRPFAAAPDRVRPPPPMPPARVCLYHMFQHSAEAAWPCGAVKEPNARLLL